MKNKFIYLSLAMLPLTGCMSLDGLDSKGSFDCKAPDGVVCDSMTGVVANLHANNLPSMQGTKAKRVEKTPVKGSVYGEQSRANRVLTTMEYTGAPLIRNPKTIRVWVAPWEGADRTLFDQQFFYIVIDNWRWNIEHNSRRVQETYAPSSASGYVAPATNYVTPTSVRGIDADAPIPTGGSVTGGSLARKGVEGVTVPRNNQEMNDQINKELQRMNLDVSQFGLPRFTN